MVTFDSTDLDNAVSESGVVHESVANTDHNDASNLKQGYSIANPYLSQDLVGYWPLQEDTTPTAYDFSGNANDGTTNGGVAVNQTGLLGTSAYSFDGVDDWVLGSSNLGISGDASLTMSCWIYWNGSSWPTKYPSAMGNDSTGSVNNGLSLTVNGGRPAIDFWSKRYHATNALSVQNWYHITVTKSPGTIGSTSSIYVNGSEVPGAVEGSDVTPSITDSPPVVGRLDSTRWFDGLVWDARWYNRALTASEIQTLYDVVATSGTLTTPYKSV